METGKPVLAIPVGFCLMMSRAFLASALLSTVLFGGPVSLMAQVPDPSQGWIQILEPRRWATEDARGIQVRAKRSLKVVGLAQHPSGIAEVRLNGVKASLLRDPNGEFRFTGYVRVVEGVEVVDVVALVSGGGGRILRSYSLEVLPAGQTFATPEEAWGAGEGGFRGRRWAVVIGISDFRDPQIPDLQYADEDARAFHEFLLSEDAGLGGFRPENTLLLLNEEATYRAIRSALLTFLSMATEDDIVIIFVAGHGVPDGERPDDIYLLPSDAEVDDLRATAVRMEEFAQAVSEVRASHLVLFADACHSAQVGGQLAARSLSVNRINRDFLEGLRNTQGGVVAFTASQVNQISREDSQWGGGHGVFTHFLLDGLGGSADQDQDRIVTVVELTEYVRDQVRRETGNEQIPSVSQTSFDSYLPLAIVPFTPADLPPIPKEAVTVTPLPPRSRLRTLPGDSLNPHLDLPPVEAPQPEPPPVQTEDSVTIARALEEQPPFPRAETEANTELAAVQYDAGAAAFKSLFIPGLGQMTTDRTGSGIAFLGGAATALSIGILKQTKEVACGARVSGECPADFVISESVERPYLATGLVVAAAFAVGSAIDAYRGARKANLFPRNASESQGRARVDLEPPRLRGSVHRWELDLVRLRF
jgi:hypothetical protein